MKKEATVAVIIGLILALVVTGGILRARHALRELKLQGKELREPSLSQSPDSNAAPLFVELTTPDNSVTATPKLAITGKTLPGTYIAILSELGEYLIVPTDLGNFSQEVNLVKGANMIHITVYQSDGTKIEESLNAVYTTAQL